MAIPAEKARRATTALQRFGLGARRSDADALARIAANPVKSLIDELNQPGMSTMDAGIVSSYNLPDYPKSVNDATNTNMAEGGDKPAIIRIRNRERRARIEQHMHRKVTIGFVERLVIFWSNHFSMCNSKSFLLQGAIGEFERNRIRPHVCGNFLEMMKGVYTHPSMVSYLDNENSIGKRSKKGLSNAGDYFGMNENLAREILELHTMSSNLANYPAGVKRYQQKDVIELARMLTGWSYIQMDQVKSGAYPDSRRGEFVYQQDWHDPGVRFFLGDYINNPLGPNGKKTAETALDRLARHPATARHIARKLILHFFTDDPEADMVKHVADVFLRNVDSKDQLRQVAAALVTYVAPDGRDCLSPKYRKLRTPYEYVVAMLRALDNGQYANKAFNDKNDGGKESNNELDNILDGLGQQIWAWQTPDGYPDESAYWLSPQGIAFRLDVALRTAKSIGDGKKTTIDPVALARNLYDSSLSSATLKAIKKSQPEDPKVDPDSRVPVAQKNGLAILFSSPEFMWR